MFLENPVKFNRVVRAFIRVVCSQCCPRLLQPVRRALMTEQAGKTEWELIQI